MDLNIIQLLEPLPRPEVLMLLWASPPAELWQCVELFSGQGNVSAAFREVGRPTASFDKELAGRAMDFTTSPGWLPGAQFPCRSIIIYFEMPKA